MAAALEEKVSATLPHDSEEEDEEDDPNQRSFALMRLAEVLREDISPVACLSCSDDGVERCRAACPCFATLHPFCDLFHTWLCHRLIDDGAGTCCLLPTQVITDPELAQDEDEDGADEAADGPDGAAVSDTSSQCDATRGLSTDSSEDDDDDDAAGKEKPAASGSDTACSCQCPLWRS